MPKSATQRLNPWTLGFILNLGLFFGMILCAIPQFAEHMNTFTGGLWPLMAYLPLLIALVLTGFSLLLFLEGKWSYRFIALSVTSLSLPLLALCKRKPDVGYIIIILTLSAWYWLFQPKRERRFEPLNIFIKQLSNSLGLSFSLMLVLLLALDLQHQLLSFVLIGLSGTFWVYSLWQFYQSQKELSSSQKQGLDNFFAHPERAIFVTFIILCLVGSLMLYAPISATTTEGLSWIDALFTAVSAVCVTGLTVKDTGLDFSFTGQLFILILIQTGGLGIMALSSLVWLILGARISLKQESTIKNAFGQKLRAEVKDLLKSVLLITFISEGVGALLLSYGFWRAGDGVGLSLWKGTFTAISAFCNAGFFMHGQNLIPYQSHFLILHTVAALIILGGISPGFILALMRLKYWHQFPLQHKMIAIVTGALVLGGTFLYGLLEWHKSLDHLTIAEKIVNAYFQSVTTRTAGFNSVDLTLMQPATIMMMIALMFIGGSPGGTAGGIKTTTLMVMWRALVATIHHCPDTTYSHRQIAQETVRQAFGVTALATCVAFLALFLLCLTQDQEFLPLFFEVVSAIGTVGLTLNITPQLDYFGKMIIILCMFIGRIGPLTIILSFMNHQHERTRSQRLPEESVVVA